MKKQAKRLVLRKETLRTLTAPRFRLAVGGIYPSQYPGCTNDTTQTSGTCPSDFCGTITCGYTEQCNSNLVSCIEPDPTLKC